MADENRIEIVATLDIPKSVDEITSKLPKLESELVKAGAFVKIGATLNTDSLTTIKNQISEFSKGLTINVGAVNAQSIQKSVTEATKNQKVEVDITTKINKSTLQKQAKEMEEILQLFDRGGKQSGRAELASLLEEYQKAFKAENYEGTVNALDKIITFTREHQRTVEVTNEELKAQQERVQGVLKDMQKLYITTEQLEAVQRELTGSKRNVQGLTTEAENFLNNYLGKGKWSDDPSKFTNVATHYWSTFVDSVNNIIHGSGNKYMELLNEGDIVEGLRNFVDFMGKSTDATNAYMRSNALTAEQWADSVGSAIAKVTGTNLAEVANWGWTDILSDETVEHTEQNAQKMAQAYSTVQAAKDLYKDDKSVKSVTSDWVFDANKNITGFTININKLNGEVERLNHTITETGEVKFLGGSGSDRGVEKQAETMIKFVNEYTAKLNSLKAKVGEQFAPNITATLGDDMQKTTVTFDSFEKKLVELLKGNGNIGELRSEFTALDGVVKSLGAQLRGSDTSLNQFTNAINNARKFDNDLKALEVDYNNLNEKQRESETLTKSLADAQKKLADLRNTQQTEGYTEKWITQYHEANIALTQLTADLKLAKKLEREDTSSAAHKQAAALREVKDAYNEILSLSRKLYQPNATGEYRAEIERQIAVYDAIVKKLEGEKEFNEEFRKEVAIYNEAYQDELRLMQLKNSEAEAQKAKNEEIARQKALQQELARIETEALREQTRQQQELDSQRKKDLSEISEIYTKIISLYGKINSTTISEADKKDAERRLSLYNDMVVAVVERAKAEGTYNQEFRRQIDEHEKIYQREYDLIQLHREDAEATKTATEQARQQAEANKAVAASTSNTIKSAMSELEKIVGNTQFGKQKDSLASMIGDTNVLKDLQSKFESAVKNASALKSEYQQLSETLKNDSSASSIQNVDEKLGLLKNDFEATTAQAKNLQTILNVLTTYAESYQKIINLNQKMSGDNVTQKEVEQYAAQIEAQKNIITEATKKLQIENLYTKALEDQKIAIKNNANEIINQRNQQKLNNQATEEYNKALRKQETELNTLRSAYKAIATQTATLVSSKSTDADKARAEEEIKYQRERIDAVWRVNTYEEMLNGIRSKAIAQGEQLISLAVQGVQEEERKADKIKAEAEAQRDYNKTLSDSNKLINDTIKALNDFNNSSVAYRNSANTNVQSQIATNTGLISQLQGFSQSLKDDSSVGNVQRIKAELDALIPTLEKATNGSAALKIQLRDMATDNKLANNLKNLESRMASFAARNREAVNSTDLMRDGVMTYGEKWQELMDRMKSTNDAAGFQRLKEDVVAYENELRSVGKVTSGFVTSLKSQLKMLVSRWVSLYAVIAKIRQAVNYVIELDDAMTKLKRVTDETTEGYERFLEVAKKSAKETYTTLTDTVTQAARWAKNGFDAATSAELAKTSLIYSIVGDIDNDTAVSDLVTALRGFRLEAEDALSVVDKLDALNNKYATDAKSLGEALTVTSSAMSAAGNDLDETLALITGATEITQNAKETGQALRTITMRIRGKLYASIWGNSYAMK